MKLGWIRRVVVLRRGGAEGFRRRGAKEDASAVNSRNDRYDIKTEWLTTAYSIKYKVIYNIRKTTAMRSCT